MFGIRNKEDWILKGTVRSGGEILVVGCIVLVVFTVRWVR